MKFSIKTPYTQTSALHYKQYSNNSFILFCISAVCVD